MLAAILRIIMRTAPAILVSFLAYKFLDIIFDLVKSYFKKKTQPLDNGKETEKIIETRFSEDTEDTNENIDV